MPLLRWRWRAGAAVASLCLAGAQCAAGDACVDQDDRWATHGSSCRQMKRLCDDQGYGSLVRKWCPRSCGLCGQETLPTPAPAAPIATEAAAAFTEPQPLPESLAATTTPGLANATLDFMGQGNSSAPTGTTTTTASAVPGTTTTTEAQLLAANSTPNETCAEEASPGLLDDSAEAPLLYQYAASPEALVPPGSIVEIEGPVVLELGPSGTQATVVQATRDASNESARGESVHEGHNTTTTSTPWDLLQWRHDRLQVADRNATDQGPDTEDAGGVRETISQLDAVLRGKRDRRRGPGQRRPTREAAGRGRSPRTSQGVESAHMDEPVLWISDQDGPPQHNASQELPLNLYDPAVPANASDSGHRKVVAGLQEKLLPRPAEAEQEEERGKCPEGYERVVGDVYGGDQFSGSRRSVAESLEECAQRCSRTPGCGSFEYSPSRKRCFRNSQTRPTHTADRLDFVFCRRAPCPSLKTQEACIGPSVAEDAYSSHVSLRPGSYCIWSGGVCQAPMACTDKDCFLPDGGLPGMELPSWQTLWISRAGLEATMRTTSLAR
mmetsp:Transcript_50386/g.150650  ORF Transcript_50386/g.150650 Transcript_50386/m.150650 type:complete len:553 (-) Transcript_50386:233-1891(-)